MKALDKFLESYLYVNSLAENGASKEAHESAESNLRKNEAELINSLNLDDARYERLLELVESFRKDETQYDALVNYVESSATTN